MIGSSPNLVDAPDAKFLRLFSRKELGRVKPSSTEELREL